MKVYVNEVTGIADAIAAMFFSKRTWTRELEEDIRYVCHEVNTWQGKLTHPHDDHSVKCFDTYNDWMTKLMKWLPIHITLGRFIDFSITVEGLHRAGQDDWDAHAKRFDNRIIRNSTRLSNFGNEMSDYYKGKIIPTDVALSIAGFTTPASINVEGVEYVKTINGYIREDMKDNKDVKRGLYMLSIPSNFIFKVNLTEWAHVYKERNENGGANPEVKQCCEAIADQLAKFQPTFTRELFTCIRN